MPSLRAVPSLALALVLVVAASGAVVGCSADDDAPALVFAAVSLADVLDEALAGEREAGAVELNLAGSNVLAEQILAGAPADLFLSADRRQVERLVAAGKVDAGEVTVLATNRLVVVVPAGGGAGALSGPRQLLGFRRLALADPAAVPAGVYARRWLEREGLWEALAGRVIPSLDARAALAAVAGGHLEAGIVYATDALSNPRVRVVYRVPPERAPRIEYVAAPIAGGDGRAATRLMAHLRGPVGQAAFRRHGFEPAPPAGTPGGPG